MNKRDFPRYMESLESRQLMSWSSYAQLVHQDTAATDFSTLTGAGVTVAVIDTGVDYTQPSLGGGFGKNFKVIGGYDFVDNDSDPMDESGHGTNVAGVIAAKPYTTGGVTYQGVAPDAKLVALRVGTDSGIPNANIKKALDWVITNYKTYGISVVNLSLGSGNYTSASTDSSFSSEFQTLHDLGIFVTAASGNSNDQQSGPISQDGIAYPAADPNVFAVGAVDSSDVITDWTQRSSELDLLAPGVSIVMPKMGGGFVTEDGTSFSSPYVAGTAALLKQEVPSAKAGDLGSILMSSGAVNRDGDHETGNTTNLLFSRLDIDAALTLGRKRVGKFSTLALGHTFDTALDSQGVLHAAYYDAANHDVLYATRDASGKWSSSQVIDNAGDVGSQLSIAVDPTGKVGIGYYDATNTAVKYASFSGTKWSNQTIDSDKFTGTSPSVGFSIYGDAYLGYYRRTGGYLRMATLDRDTGKWTRRTIDGSATANVGANLSLDVGQAAIRQQFFTVYHTTVAIAYADSTNGDLKYARLDVDDPTATWFISTVDNLSGVNNIDLKLHAGFLSSSSVQAQIAYQDVKRHVIKYAYRNQDWFTENVASSGGAGGAVQLSFTSADDPSVTYFNSAKRALYSSDRSGSGNWSSPLRLAPSSALASVSLNDRADQTILSYLNKSKTAVVATDLV